MPTRTLTATEVAEIIGNDGITEANEWLARGDGIAVYQDKAFDSSTMGQRRIFSFGSSTAQFDVPPERLPDFPGEINWRYQLEGVYRSNTALTPPAEHDWATPTTVLRLIMDSFKSKIIGRPDRLIAYQLDVNRYVERSTVTMTLHVTDSEGASPRKGRRAPVRPVAHMGGNLLTPLTPDCTITVTTLTNELGEVDRLGSFWWTITGVGPVQQGVNDNLGSTIVNVHNLSMDRD